jgi:hypothetical protein
LSQGTPFPLNLDFTFAVLGVEVAFTVLHYVDDPICQSEVYTEISDLDLCLAHRTLFRAFVEAKSRETGLWEMKSEVMDVWSAIRKLSRKVFLSIFPFRSQWLEEGKIQCRECFQDSR